jgi:hypothetical protein
MPKILKISIKALFFILFIYVLSIVNDYFNLKNHSLLSIISYMITLYLCRIVLKFETYILLFKNISKLTIKHFLIKLALQLCWLIICLFIDDLYTLHPFLLSFIWLTVELFILIKYDSIIKV